LELLEFLDSNTLDNLSKDIADKFNLFISKHYDIPFTIVDRDGKKIISSSEKKWGGFNLSDSVRNDLDSGKQYALEKKNGSIYELIIGLRVDGSNKGFLSCEIDFSDKTFLQFSGHSEESTKETMVEMIVAYVSRCCAFFEEQENLKKCETRVKHSENALDVLRDHHQEIAVENIRQQEELENKNVQLQEKQAQLEDYGRNLEKKVKERTKELLKQKERAEEADKLKSQLLANMSHEIRTPLNVIIGFVDLVLSDELSDNHRNYLEKVKRNGALLLALINDILDLSKIEANQVKVEKIPVDLENLCEEIYSNMNTLILQKGKNIEVRKNFCPETKNYILTDPVRLQQVITNLIGNAVKFTDTGFIELGTSLPKGDHLLFHVKDSGIGIPDDKQDMVFQTFQQADMSTTRKYGGTGLGLAISRKLVELMGGKMWLESKEGEGTVFYFTHPLKVHSSPALLKQGNAKKETPEKEVLEEGVVKERRILIAEDSPDNQLLAERILTKYGYEVFLANDGREAVKFFKEKRAKIDLILMDIQMPNMGGLEATGIIRDMEEKKNLRKIPIIALTANAMKEDMEKYLAGGCDDFVAKPINRKLLLSTIKNYLK